jgi:prepilin signal peptidase PulO-like enzyme (type II secretory pathway)
VSAELDLTETGPTPARSAGALLVPLATGWGIACLCYTRNPGGGVLLLAATLAWWIAVVVIIRSDLSSFIIPDEASAAVAFLGLIQAAALPIVAAEGPTESGLAGAAALGTGAGAFLLFALVRQMFRSVGRDALGYGDVKLAGACAIWLAPGDAALALEIAAFGAVAMVLVTRWRGAAREAAVPFGAFMAPAAWLVYVAGPVVRDIVS